MGEGGSKPGGLSSSKVVFVVFKKGSLSIKVPSVVLAKDVLVLLRVSNCRRNISAARNLTAVVADKAILSPEPVPKQI